MSAPSSTPTPSCMPPPTCTPSNLPTEQRAWQRLSSSLPPDVSTAMPRSRSRRMRGDGGLQELTHPIHINRTSPSSQDAGPAPSPTAVLTSTSTPSPSPTSAAPASFFNFISTPNVPKCARGKVEWSHSGADTTISLQLTSSSGNGPHVPLGSNLNVNADSFSWYANYTSGMYVMTATGPGIDVTSLPFQIVKSEPVISASTYTSSDTQNTQNTQNTRSTQSTQSGASTSAAAPTGGAEQGHSSPMAGIIVGSVAAVIVIAIVGICVSALWRRRARNASVSRPSTRRRSANWIGLSYDDDDDFPDSSGSSPMDEKSLEGSVRKPPVALSRLEPNRRKPSTHSFTPIPVTTPTSPLGMQPDVLIPTKTAMDAERADSPANRRNSYRTRKPVPQLLPAEDEAGEMLSAGELESPKEDGRSPTSAVPSSATSRMYRGRDSGYSARSRLSMDKENARASSVIDPQLFGACAKPMQSVVPAVPPLPSF
ncbi:hypothetical protein C8Q73DRAFT_260280 [Cubamyces lactineus]|nr:hypothetical protein C8Q73DRAFT_260280 [Cubamyces lactineus]